MVQHVCSNCTKTFKSKTGLKNHKKSCVAQTTEESFVPKDYDGTVVWKLQDDPNINQDEKSPIIQEAINKMMSIITSCHQILYNNGAIVGSKAMSDIMKLLSLKLFNKLFADKKSFLSLKLKKLVQNNEISEKDIDRFNKYCLDFRKLKENDNIINEIKCLTLKVLCKVLPNLYTEKDIYLHCSNEKGIVELINQIDKVDDIFIDTISGDVYEYFMNKYLGNGGKELGQHFTPRKLINLMLYGTNIFTFFKNKKDITIYDPCMGSGGFLTRAYNVFKENINKLIGSEIESDTIRFGIIGLLLTTHEYPKHLFTEDTLKSYNNYFADLILTNPPFGTSMKYSKEKKSDQDGLFEFFTKNRKENYPNFKDIYPIKSNDGPCLFLQHCIYKLKENGICGVVLPDGKLLTSNSFTDFRKWLCEKVQILKLIFVPSKVFEHTPTKTCIMIFSKNGISTETIELFRTNINCDEIVKICNITINDLSYKNYKFDDKCYVRDTQQELLIENSSVEWEAFGKIFELHTGEFQSSKVIEDVNGKGLFITQSKNINDCKKISYYKYDNKCLFIGNIDSGKKFCIRYYDGKCDNSNLLEYCKVKEEYINKINVKYIYYYLLSIQEKLTTEYLKGANNLSLNKDKFNIMKIPTPTLEVQNKIVLELDKITEQIKTIELLKVQIEKEMKLYMNYGLSKEVNTSKCNKIKLGEIVQINPENLTKKNSLNWINYIDITSVNTGVIESIRKILINDIPSRAKRIIKKNDIIYSSVRPNLKNYSYIENNIENGIVSTGFAVIRIKDQVNINSKYIYYQLINDDVIDFLCKNTKGNQYPTVDFNTFKDIIISIPSFEIQNKFVLQLNKLSEEILNLNKKQTQLKEYSKYILEISY